MHIGDPRLEGSSPLARGLRRQSREQRVEGGIIPARAGFTHHDYRATIRSRDHPRSRGVYLCPTAYHSPSYGSSPLARGLRHGPRRRPQHPRIIPARAGFTCPRASRRPRSWDHPRSRGVYTASLIRSDDPEGSSPLARGLLEAEDFTSANIRIIPARAGFTSWHDRVSFLYWDHPRSRGVYGAGENVEQFLDGSSPLARGLRTPGGVRPG